MQTLEKNRFDIAQAYGEEYNFEDFNVVNSNEWTSNQDTFICKIKIQEDDEAEQEGILKLTFFPETDEVMDIVAEYQGVEFGYPNVPFGLSLGSFN